MDSFSGSMDPMQVLPQELILRICSFLSTHDLLRLWELNHSWRRIVTDHSLWRDYFLVVPGFCSESGMPGIVHSLRVLRRAPCLGCIMFDGPKYFTPKQKLELLNTEALVLRMDYLSCHAEIENWLVPFIQHIGPRLEEIEVAFPSTTMLNTLITLPRLTKLIVKEGRTSSGAEPPGLTTGCMGQLKVFKDEGFWTLQPIWLLAFLKTHNHTLEEISLGGHLHVLQTLIQDGYQFKTLKRLEVNDCVSADLDALRLMLPGVDILSRY